VGVEKLTEVVHPYLWVEDIKFSPNRNKMGLCKYIQAIMLPPCVVCCTSK